MTRSILVGSWAQPVWGTETRRLEAPDEDTFSLAVEALRGLGSSLRSEGPRRLHRLHLVGAYGPESDWGFAEALGFPGLEVRHHPATGAALWGALAAAAHDEGPPGREAVVVAQVAAPSLASATDATDGRPGAGAAAFLLGTEAGLSVLRHGYRGTSPGRLPSMKSAVEGWLDAVGISPTGAGSEAIFVAEENTARWHATWDEVAPGVLVTFAGASHRPGAGSSPLSAATLLWELARRLRTGQIGLVTEVAAAHSGFAGFRLDGPVRWRGGWADRDPGVPVPTPSFLDRGVDTAVVSQGAYVPHPRYLENLPSRWRLEADRCPRCKAVTFPISGRCGSCGAVEGLRREALGREGLLVESVTTIGPGAQPTEFDPVVRASGSYDVALVSLAPGARGTFQVADGRPGELHIGNRVRLVLRRLYPMEGEWRYGLKAVRESGGGVTPAVRRPRRRPSSGAPTVRRASPRARAGPTGKRPRGKR